MASIFTTGFCLNDLILYVPVNNFQLCRDGSYWVEQVFFKKTMAIHLIKPPPSKYHLSVGVGNKRYLFIFVKMLPRMNQYVL